MSMEIQEYREALEIADTPQEMALKLADMKAKLGLVQRFFREVMVLGQDYGTLPGTDKPSLLKAGAEKLCELYGFAPAVKQVEEEKDIETGFYRARVVVALIHRRSGVVVAEGVGEANTMEGKYRYRWVPEWRLPEGIDRTALYSEVRKDKDGKKYRMYRLENQDPWSLWNTVLKTAKKRALVDATLSATRSSGLFTQDLEDLEEWIGGSVVVDVETSEAPSEAETSKAEKLISDAQRKRLFAIAGDEKLVRTVAEKYGYSSTKDIPKTQYEAICNDIIAMKKAQENATETIDFEAAQTQGGTQNGCSARVNKGA